MIRIDLNPEDEGAGFPPQGCHFVVRQRCMSRVDQAADPLFEPTGNLVSPRQLNFFRIL